MVSRVQAIRDGVIEASINHEKGFVQSKETMDIYGTREPQLAFHQRISFCLDIHNMSVKVTRAHTLMHACGLACSDATLFLPLQAMRFPPKAYNKDLESAEVITRAPPVAGQEVDSSVSGAFRSVGSVSSRIWSLPKRWLKMMTTASPNLPDAESVHLAVSQNSLLHAVLFVSIKPLLFSPLGLWVT